MKADERLIAIGEEISASLKMLVKHIGHLAFDGPDRGPGAVEAVVMELREIKGLIPRIDQNETFIVSAEVTNTTQPTR